MKIGSQRGERRASKLRLSGALAGLVIVFAALALSFAPIPEAARPEAAVEAPPGVPLGLTPRAPILIASNLDFTTANGVVGGTGAPSDPFVIAGWEINASGGVAVEIRDTTAYFVIRDSNASGGDGIRLSRVTDGRIENVTVFRGWTGISVSESTRVVIERNVVSLSYDGIVVGSSAGIELLGNDVFANFHFGIIAQSSEPPLRVVGNRVSSNSEGGVSLAYVTDVDLASNTITGNGGHGVNMYNNANANVTGNIVTGNAERGLWITESEGVSVTRNNVSGNGEGFFLGPHRSATVGSNTISGNRDYGLMNYFSTGLVIDNNTFAGNGGAGIHLYQDTGLQITRNSFQDDGVYLYGDYVYGDPVGYFNSHTITPDNLVNGVPIAYYRDCSGTVIDGISVGQLIVANCTGARIANLTIAQADYGVQLDMVDNTVLEGLRLSDNDGAGLYLYRASSVTVTNSDIARSGEGVEVVLSSNVTLDRVRVTTNSDGVLSMSSVDTTFRDVLVTSNAQRGIALYYSDRIELTTSNVTSNPVGVEVASASYVLVAASRIGENAQGLVFYCCGRGSIIRGNDLVGNGLAVGIHQMGYLTFYHNNFLGNTANALNDGGWQIAWDDGYPSGGNFWDTYAGVDNCSGVTQTQCPDPDGIGDVPFSIDAANRDRYPLTGRFGSVNRVPFASFNITPVAGPPATVFAFDASRSLDPEDGPLEVRWDWESDGAWDTAWSATRTATHAFALRGAFSVHLEVRDSGGLVDDVSHVLYVDDAAPVTTAYADGTRGRAGWYVSLVWLTLVATDDLSGVAATEYRLDGGTWLRYTGRFWLYGRTNVEYRSRDVAGNVEATRALDLLIDAEAPALSIVVDGIHGALDWYRSPVTVTLAAMDSGSGLDRIDYRLNGGLWNPYAGPLVLQEGFFSLEYGATDVAGNQALTTVPIGIDWTPPRVEGISPAGVVTTSRVVVSWSVLDNVSGIVRTDVGVDGAPPVSRTAPLVLFLHDGEHRVRIAAVDSAGNEAVAEATFVVDTSPLSITGPYGGAPIFSLLGAEAGVLLIVFLRWRRRRRPPPDSAR